MSPSVTASPKTTTTYTVIATRSDGCTKIKTVTVNVNNLNNLESSTTKSISIGSNATIFSSNSSLDINLPSAEASILSIMNMQGTLLKTTEITGTFSSFPTTELPAGIYLVTIKQVGQLYKSKVQIVK